MRIRSVISTLNANLTAVETTSDLERFETARMCAKNTPFSDLHNTFLRNVKRVSCTLLLISLSFINPLAGSLCWGQSASIAIVDDRSVHVPYEYEVEDGDTLWLLSQEFFNDPWLWPNLWALNPHITNPHWIYPGDIIRLKWTPQAVAESQGEDFNLEPVSYSADLQKVARLIVNRGMILDHVKDAIGQVTASPESKSNLSTGDRIYLEVKDPSKITLGQTLSIYRPQENVSHPDTRESLGVKVLYIGVAEVVERGDDQQLIKAIITSSEREMERGDLVFGSTEKLIEVNPTKNLVDLEGVIIDSIADISEFGQHHMVFINVGSEEGVQVGNRLAVARRGDGLMKQSAEKDAQMPLEPVGELMVIATQAHTASALITRSTLELRRGDQVLMLRNY